MLLRKIKDIFTGNDVYFDDDGKKHKKQSSKLDNYDKAKIGIPLAVICSILTIDIASLANRSVAYNENRFNIATEVFNSQETKDGFLNILSNHNLDETFYTYYTYAQDWPSFQPGGENYGTIPHDYYEAVSAVDRYFEQIGIQVDKLVGPAPEFVFDSMNLLEIGIVIGSIALVMVFIGAYFHDKKISKQ